MMLDTKSEQKWPLIACEKRDQGSFLFVLGRLTRSLIPMGMGPIGVTESYLPSEHHSKNHLS